MSSCFPMKLKSVLLWSLLFTLPNQTLANQQCFELFSLANSNSTIHKMAEDLSHQTAQQVERTLTATRMNLTSKRGYAILIGTMVGSAFLTTYIGSQISADFPASTIFISILTGFGVSVVGSPILEPLSSQFRQWAFRINKSSTHNPIANQSRLESLWRLTQVNYSLNAQMSGNRISQFIFSIRQNFSDAYRAYESSDKNYSADQIAEAAYRMRILFKEIPPDDPSVSAAVRTVFTHHIEISPDFVDIVIEKIKKLDPDFLNDEQIQNHYNAVLQTWLNL